MGGNFYPDSLLYGNSAKPTPFLQSTAKAPPPDRKEKTIGNGIKNRRCRRETAYKSGSACAPFPRLSFCPFSLFARLCGRALVLASERAATCIYNKRTPNTQPPQKKDIGAFRSRVYFPMYADNQTPPHKERYRGLALPCRTVGAFARAYFFVTNFDELSTEKGQR